MDDLLTTRQLQDLLHVDRITIYRMLGDGRLAGFKVGGQWRFSRREIESWLERQQAHLIAGEAGPIVDGERPAQPLPIACVQAIQSIYAEALDIAAVTVDPQGEPLTAVSNSCAFCNIVRSTELGRRRCAAAWGRSGGRVQTCHAGLLVAAAPVHVGGECVAAIAGCQFTARPADGERPAWTASLPAVAAGLGVAEAELEAAAASVRRVDPAGIARIVALAGRVAATFAEIGHERQQLIGRLRRIAEMTNV